jgi:hypothetical protein
MQPVHDLLQSLQRNGLLAILQPMQAGGRDPELPGKYSISRASSPFTEEDRKLIVQRLPHWGMLDNWAFLLRNNLLEILLDSVPRMALLSAIATQ